MLGGLRVLEISKLQTMLAGQILADLEIIFQGTDWTEAEAWEKQMPIAAVAIDSHDRVEGLNAFVEKRNPVWTGR